MFEVWGNRWPLKDQLGSKHLPNSPAPPANSQMRLTAVAQRPVTSPDSLYRQTKRRPERAVYTVASAGPALQEKQHSVHAKYGQDTSWYWGNDWHNLSGWHFHSITTMSSGCWRCRGPFCPQGTPHWPKQAVRSLVRGTPLEDPLCWNQSSGTVNIVYSGRRLSLSGYGLSFTSPSIHELLRWWYYRMSQGLPAWRKRLPCSGVRVWKEP